MIRSFSPWRCHDVYYIQAALNFDTMTLGSRMEPGTCKQFNGLSPNLHRRGLTRHHSRQNQDGSQSRSKEEFGALTKSQTGKRKDKKQLRIITTIIGAFLLKTRDGTGQRHEPAAAEQRLGYGEYVHVLGVDTRGCRPRLFAALGGLSQYEARRDLTGRQTGVCFVRFSWVSIPPSSAAAT